MLSAIASKREDFRNPYEYRETGRYAQPRHPAHSSRETLEPTFTTAELACREFTTLLLQAAAREKRFFSEKALAQGVWEPESGVSGLAP